MEDSFESTGLALLASLQEKDGSFLSYTSPTLSPFTSIKSYQTVFSTALILSCLNSLPSKDATARIRERAANFLLQQKGTHWTWNYWSRSSPEFHQKPCPDDADDTFCVLSALWQYDRSRIPGDALAHIVTRLCQIEAKVGGPYATWFVPKSAEPVWHDVDVVVNANIAFFLSLQGIRLKNLEYFFDDAIRRRAFSSPYYPHSFPFIYFVSRSYSGSMRTQLRGWLRQEQGADASWGTTLKSALALSALHRLGVPQRDLASDRHSLLKACGEGRNLAEGFCLDPAQDGKKFFHGSVALTTAFCLEALAVSARDVQRPSHAPTNFHETRKQVLDVVAGRCEKLGPEFSHISKKMLTHAEKLDHDHQIVILPHLFSEALALLTPAPQQAILAFCQATVFGWFAYTLYDDFYDGDGDPRTLGFANTCLRELTVLFHSSMKDYPDYLAFFHSVIDKMEAFTAWEMRACRFLPGELKAITIPEFTSSTHIAQKSFGHALGPLALVVRAGHGVGTTEFKIVSRWFECYLSARQLLDDAHDWELDVRSGQISYVTALLLRHQFESKVGAISIIEQRRLFWHFVLPIVAQEVSKLLDEAASLSRQSPFVRPQHFENSLQRLRDINTATIEEQQRALAFLSHYQRA